MKSANALLANTGEHFEELAGYIDSAAGSAAKMADTQLDNLTGDITLFQSALEGAEIVLSDQITPLLREFVQFGTSAVGQLSETFQQGGLSGAMDALGTIIKDGLALLIAKLPDFVDAGVQLLSAIGSGIKNMTKWLKDKVTGFFSSIVGSVKGVLGVHSPSRVFAGIGSYMMKGLAQGISGGARFATGAMKNAVAAVKGAAALRLPSISLPQIPRLAQGGVIPANREFLAVLGDQRSGNNIEAPEALLRQMAQEAVGANTGLLREIIELMRSGRVLVVNDTTFAELAYKANNNASNRHGGSLVSVRAIG